MRNSLTQKAPQGVIVLGNGIFSKLISHYILCETTQKIAAYTVEKDYITDESFLGAPVVPFEDVECSYPPKQYNMIMGIGYSQMNSLRERLFWECKKKGYYVDNFIHTSAIIANNTAIGEGNIIMEQVTIQPFSSLGDCNLIWYGAAVGHDSKIGSFNMLASRSTLLGNITVQDRCFIGAGAVVQEERTIAKETLLGMGSICKQNTVPNQVLVAAKSVVLNNKKSTDYL